MYPINIILLTGPKCSGNSMLTALLRLHKLLPSEGNILFAFEDYRKIVETVLGKLSIGYGLSFNADKNCWSYQPKGSPKILFFTLKFEPYPEDKRAEYEKTLTHPIPAELIKLSQQANQE